MNKVVDTVALLSTALALAAFAWVVLHYSGRWFFPAATVVVLVALALQNHRLKKRMRRMEKDRHG
jgi:hypothetical protein